MVHSSSVIAGSSWPHERTSRLRRPKETSHDEDPKFEQVSQRPTGCVGPNASSIPYVCPCASSLVGRWESKSSQPFVRSASPQGVAASRAQSLASKPHE